MIFLDKIKRLFKNNSLRSLEKNNFGGKIRSEDKKKIKEELKWKDGYVKYAGMFIFQKWGI